ncbi:MAG: hypothetical protein ACRC5H_07695, partial [Treponemataceae bacterium]
MYIAIKNNKICGVLSGQKPQNTKDIRYESVPSTASVQAGESIAFYDANWVKKTDRQLVEEKLIEIPKGMKLDGDCIVKMNKEEKVIAGLEPCDVGFKVVEGEILPKTLDEKLTDGEITQQEFSQIKT